MSHKMLEITGVDVKDLIRESYNLSSPQGLGYLHYEKGPLQEEIVEQLDGARSFKNVRVSMDYVLGRAVKLTVHQKNDRLFIPEEWYDHIPEQYDELFSRLGLEKNLVEGIDL